MFIVANYKYYCSIVVYTASKKERNKVTDLKTRMIEHLKIMIASKSTTDEDKKNCEMVLDQMRK